MTAHKSNTLYSAEAAEAAATVFSRLNTSNTRRDEEDEEYNRRRSLKSSRIIKPKSKYLTNDHGDETILGRYFFYGLCVWASSAYISNDVGFSKFHKFVWFDFEINKNAEEEVKGEMKAYTNKLKGVRSENEMNLSRGFKNNDFQARSENVFN